MLCQKNSVKHPFQNLFLIRQLYLKKKKRFFDLRFVQIRFVYLLSLSKPKYLKYAKLLCFFCFVEFEKQLSFLTALVKLSIEI